MGNFSITSILSAVVMTVFAVVGLGVSVTSGSASTINPSLVVPNVECNVSSVSGATACAGVFSGNNSNQSLGGFFGIADWGDEIKIDSNSGSEMFAGTTLTVSNVDKEWKLSNAGLYTNLMFVLKGGPTFSAFLMDLNVLQGTWDTQSMLTGNGARGAGLSHWSVYINSGPGDVTTPPVPLPAAAWMLLAALGMLGVMRVRRS